uniref:Uncharacterized protein n=1 Tax=Rhizophagus irregularis (strain DAOM 181602 / DAOM 197198 / MUCL 43194) TaxID=747089 RepID=U9TDC4_RHIID
MQYHYEFFIWKPTRKKNSVRIKQNSKSLNTILAKDIAKDQVKEVIEEQCYKKGQIAKTVTPDTVQLQQAR